MGFFGGFTAKKNPKTPYPVLTLSYDLCMFLKNGDRFSSFFSTGSLKYKSPQMPLESIFKKMLLTPSNLPLLWKLARIYLEKNLILTEERLGLNSILRQKKYKSTRNKSRTRDLPPIISFLIDNSMRVDDIESFYDSMSRQTQPNWQIVVVPLQKSEIILKINDKRLFVLPSQDCHGRAQTLFTCLPYISGAWVIYVYPGITFNCDLVEEISEREISTPQADIFYWDEAYRSESDHLTHPFFKPAWSPELWLSIDILDQACFRVTLLKSFFERWDQQDWLASFLKDANVISHVDGIYSTLNNPGWQTPELVQAHSDQIRAWLCLQGKQNIQISSRPGEGLHSKWNLSAEKVSIIIPTHNHYDDLVRCVNSLFSITDYSDFEVILMDDHSSDPFIFRFYQELLDARKNVQIVHNQESFNFNRVCNQGAAIATGNILLFLNNDIEIVDPQWLTELVQLAQLPGVGAVGGRLFYPDGRIQHTGIVVGLTGHANHIFLGEKEETVKQSPYGPIMAYRNVSAVTGACLLISRKIFEQVNGFDERYQLVFSDITLCLRVLAAGYRVVLNPWARLVHYEGQSRSHHIPIKDICLASDDLQHMIEAEDPFYNPNLSRAVCYPTRKRWYEMPAGERLDTIVRFEKARQKGDE